MYRQKNEHEEQIRKIQKINDEKIKKNEEKMEIMNKSLREIDLKEKTFMQNKISAENDYNYLSRNIYKLL